MTLAFTGSTPSFDDPALFFDRFALRFDRFALIFVSLALSFDATNQSRRRDMHSRSCGLLNSSIEPAPSGWIAFSFIPHRMATSADLNQSIPNLNKSIPNRINFYCNSSNRSVDRTNQSPRLAMSNTQSDIQPNGVCCADRGSIADEVQPMIRDALAGAQDRYDMAERYTFFDTLRIPPEQLELSQELYALASRKTRLAVRIDRAHEEIAVRTVMTQTFDCSTQQC